MSPQFLLANPEKTDMEIVYRLVLLPDLEPSDFGCIVLLA
jgi:hypothetical protein